MVTSSKGTYASTLCLPGLLLSVLLTSSRPLLTHASAGDSQTLTDKSYSVSCSITAPFPWVLVCAKVCLCPPRISVSLVLWKFCNQILLIFKFRFPADAQSLCWIPRLGRLPRVPERLQQCESFFGVIVLQCVSHLPGGSTVELIVTSIKRTFVTCYTSQDSCCKSLCPRSRPL